MKIDEIKLFIQALFHLFFNYKVIPGNIKFFSTSSYPKDL